ncbi:MAG: nucleoside phosphorylase [Aurantibacter sp.]
MVFGSSELILNADKSIYHLNLLPEDIADTIITVGDPDRVEQVSSYFDTIELKKGKREFITHTGKLRGKRITVISTGIGTDNIDIVLNELDALANIDFSSRTVKKEIKRLDLVRIGTSGAIQTDIAVDSFLLSEYAIGFDSLLSSYRSESVRETAFEKALVDQISGLQRKSTPYVVRCDDDLASTFTSNRIRLGINITASGFYGPQSRRLRLEPEDPNQMEKIIRFKHEGRRLTNLEMETSGIYGLSKLLGHRAVSLNAILANRATGEFSKNPEKTVEDLIKFTLKKLTP